MARTPEQKKKDADYHKAKRARERANGIKPTPRKRTAAQKEKDKLYRREKTAREKEEKLRLQQEGEDPQKRQLAAMSARKTSRKLTHGSPATSASGRSESLSVLSSAMKQQEKENETFLSAQRTRELEASAASDQAAAAKERAISERIQSEMMLSAQKERQGYATLAQKLLEEENGPKPQILDFSGVDESFVEDITSPPKESDSSSEDDRKPSPKKKAKTTKTKKSRRYSSSSSEEDRKPSPKKPAKKNVVKKSRRYSPSSSSEDSKKGISVGYSSDGSSSVEVVSPQKAPATRRRAAAKPTPVKAKPSAAKKTKSAAKPPLAPTTTPGRTTRATRRTAPTPASRGSASSALGDDSPVPAPARVRRDREAEGRARAAAWGAADKIRQDKYKNQK